MLEAVQVDRNDSRLPQSSGGARQGLPHSVAEQGTVREVGQKVVQGNLCELSLEGLAFPDVARGQDDLPDGGVVQEVDGDSLHLAPRAGDIPQAPLDRLGDGPPGGHSLDERLGSVHIVGVNESRDRPAHEL